MNANVHANQPPIANAGISQTVNENTRITLDGSASYAPNGGIITAYQWTQMTTGVPVILIGVNTPTPTFTAPKVHTDTLLTFSLRVMDNHGAISNIPAIMYVIVKQSIANGDTNLVPIRSFGISPHQQQSPIIIPGQSNRLFHPQLP